VTSSRQLKYLNHYQHKQGGTMHVVQLVLIDAEGIDVTNRGEVDRYTEMQLTNEEQTIDYWWDWFAIGGRWEDYLQETIGSTIWPNPLDSPVALKLTKDNWPLAIKLLEKTMEHRARELLGMVKELKDTGVDLNEYILNLNTEIDDWKIPYYIRNIFALKNGDWTPDSGYVDATNWMNASPERLLNYLKDPENSKDGWDGQIENHALVVVDFHH
jgi:hypothetical protein